MHKKLATEQGPRTTKATLAYKRVRKMIIEGQFTHESKISLRYLAEKLGMSVVPVSEAVRKLEQEGFLETKPQSGMKIARPSASQTKDMRILRLAIEAQAVRIVAQKADSRNLEQIRKLTVKIRKLLQENKQDEAAYIDFELHRKIVSSAGCKLLTEKYDQIATLCMISSGKWDDNWPRLEAAGKSASHKEIMEALCSKNPDKAETAIRNHIGLGI